jgi:hypothetical protein
MQADLSRESEQLTGGKVIGFVSDNHLDPDLAVEVFVLEPQPFTAREVPEQRVAVTDDAASGRTVALDEHEQWSTDRAGRSAAAPFRGEVIDTRRGLSSAMRDRPARVVQAMRRPRLCGGGGRCGWSSARRR